MPDETIADRIVTCVNACADIANPAAVPDLLAACEAALDRLIPSGDKPFDPNKPIEQSRRETAAVVAQLRASIKKARGA